MLDFTWVLAVILSCDPHRFDKDFTVVIVLLDIYFAAYNRGISLWTDIFASLLSNYVTTLQYDRTPTKQASLD